MRVAVFTVNRVLLVSALLAVSTLAMQGQPEALLTVTDWEERPRVYRP